MKNILAKLVAAFLVVTLSMTVGIAAAKVPSAGDLEEIALCQYNAILDGLKAESNHNKTLVNGNDFYSDYYGGCYIDGNQELVVLVTDTENDHLAHVRTLADDNNLKYEHVEHSYNELLEIVEKVSDYMDYGEDVALREWLIGCGIADDKNQVSVYITVMDDKLKDKFHEEISSSDAVLFKESSPIILDSVHSKIEEEIGCYVS